MIFEKSIGHSEIKNRLENAVLNEKVSHAYIFAGRYGVGKNTLAREFAYAVTDGNIADIVVVSNEIYDEDSKSESLTVKTIRNASADMYIKPYAANKRVFIFPNAEKMTVQAQNALLKVFEEPPGYCVIILITQNDRMLIKTIRSRAITLRFGMLKDEEVKLYLKQKGIECRPVVLRLASGSIGLALKLSENDEIVAMFDEFVALFKSIAFGKAFNAYKIISYFSQHKKDAEILFDIMLIMLRDTMLKNKTDLFIEGISISNAVNMINKIENTRNSFSFNANYDIAVSEMMLDMLGEING